jgi:hypothetical protein
VRDVVISERIVTEICFFLFPLGFLNDLRLIYLFVCVAGAGMLGTTYKPSKSAKSHCY